jgi:hypothetical protein
MDTATLAALLTPHVDDGWELVADIARPGVAAKVAAVRNGAATTAVLGVADAVRVTAEVADPAVATRGDRRKAVLVAAGDTSVARRVAPTAALLDGDLDDVVARIAARSTTTPAMISVFLAAEGERRHVLAEPLARIADIGGLALIFAERADSLGPDGVVAFYRELDHALRLETNAASATSIIRHRTGLQRARMPDAALRALAGWLAQHGGARDRLLQGVDDHPAVKDPIPAGAGAGLAAIAVGCIQRPFAGPTPLVAALLARHRGAPTVALLRTVAASGITWAATRDAFSATQSLQVAQIVEMLGDVNVDRTRSATFIADALSDLFSVPYTQSTAPCIDGQHLATRYVDRIGPLAALRLAAACVPTSYGVNDVRAQLLYTTVAALIGDLAVDEVTALRAQDGAVDAHIRRVLAQHLHRSGEQSTAMWRHTLAAVDTSLVVSAIRNDNDLAARWTAHLAARVEHVARDHELDLGELWQAVCTLAVGASLPTDELVDIAAATLSGT